jgi:ubiquinone/menaquinone biosynthesis C-methylase UbiE
MNKSRLCRQNSKQTYVSRFENQRTGAKITLASWLRKIRFLLPQQIHGPLAVLYEKVAIPGLRQFHQQVASEITSSLTSGKVLDVGTGPGHLLVEIARRNPDLKLTGCDLSRKMLKIAKQSLARDRIAVTDSVSTDADTNASVQLVRADVRDIPFPDNTFDMVVSTLSIHHWRDPAGGIRECLRVTAPHGRCWIYDLRTDVPVGALAKSVTGGKFARLVLGWIFKFHGVKPSRYQAHAVTSWLYGGATVRTETHETYLKIEIEKFHCESQHRTTSSKNVSSVDSAALPI